MNIALQRCSRRGKNPPSECLSFAEKTNILVLLLAYLLAACSIQPSEETIQTAIAQTQVAATQTQDALENPESTFFQYKQACDTGDLATAKSLLTDDAIQQSKELPMGECGFLPDKFINYLRSWWFVDQEPQFSNNMQPEQVELFGNTAKLYWTDGGNDKRVVMYLYKEAGGWKIQEILLLP